MGVSSYTEVFLAIFERRRAKHIITAGSTPGAIVISASLRLTVAATEWSTTLWIVIHSLCSVCPEYHSGR